MTFAVLLFALSLAPSLPRLSFCSSPARLSCRPLLLSLLALYLLRGYWLPSLQQLYPRMESASLLPALLLMLLLFLSTALLNFLAVRTKVKV